MRVAFCIALALLAGCAGSGDLGWIDETLYGTRAVGPAKAAYTGADRVKVYEHPDASSPVQAVLTVHEQVRRYQSQAGFAYVEAEGNVSGWVLEQQLVAKKPGARKPAAPEPTPPATAPPSEPTPPSAEPAPEPEPSPAPDEEPESSVFDPY